MCSARSPPCLVWALALWPGMTLGAPGLREVLEDRVAAKDNVSRLFSQLTLSRAACYKAAARDLKKLLRKAPENCKEHLMNFYCEIVEDAQSFNTCAQLQDKKAQLEYYECIARPVSAVDGMRKPFSSQCPLSERTTEKGVPLQLRSVGSIRLAFLLLAHRSALNVQRLLSRIHSPNHEYLVHVDVKSPEVKAEIEKSSLARWERLEIFSEVNVTQGGNDLLQINILGLKRLLKTPRWEYMVKLSEFDYPVAPLYALEQYLWAAQDLNFVGLDSCYKGTCSRHMGTACEGRAYSFLSTLRMYKPLSYGMKFARGSEWLALTWDFSRYLMKELEKLHSPMHEVWTDALLLYQPDESFFHTALLNSPFCMRHVNRHLHYIPTILPEKILHGKQDEIGTRSPAFLTAADYSAILEEKAARPIFFARKLQDAPHEATMRLCRKLDSRSTQDGTSWAFREIAWPGLLQWLEEHLEKWMALKRPSGSSSTSDTEPSESNGSCPDEAAQRNSSLQWLKREPSLPRDGAQRTEQRFTPESWHFGNAQSATYRLVERLATPKRGLGMPGAGGFGMSLLVARLGTAWLEESEIFEGHVSIVPSRGKMLSFVTYWSPQVPDPDLPEVLVAGPGKSCQARKKMEEIHKWGTPLVLQLACDLPPGLHRVQVKLRKDGATQAVAWRDFLVFQAMRDVGLDHMRRFFDLEEVRPEVLKQSVAMHLQRTWDWS
ncbi:unnamed protein product [Durusdinium trenchii]|uniref:protein xylosyltransferase n=2 Tax=Durusdinium trenchii TaxID=1381693 RepID=A0ABP0NR59_9DINO